MLKSAAARAGNTSVASAVTQSWPKRGPSHTIAQHLALLDCMDHATVFILSPCHGRYCRHALRGCDEWPFMFHSPPYPHRRACHMYEMKEAKKASIILVVVSLQQKTFMLPLKSTYLLRDQPTTRNSSRPEFLALDLASQQNLQLHKP